MSNLEHNFGARGTCTNCGCSEGAVRAYGWACQLRSGMNMSMEDFQVVHKKVEEVEKLESLRLLGMSLSMEEREAKAKALLVGVLEEIDKLGVRAYHSPGSHDGELLKVNTVCVHTKSHYEITGIP